MKNHCFSNNHKVLTRQGWTPARDLVAGDVVVGSGTVHSIQSTSSDIIKISFGE